MLDDLIIPRVEQAFENWVDAGKPGTFCQFLDRDDKSTLKILERLPKAKKRLAAKVRKALDVGRPEPKKLLPLRYLRHHLSQILETYQQTAKSDDSLDAFLEKLRQKHPDEASLRKFLDQQKDST